MKRMLPFLCCIVTIAANAIAQPVITSSISSVSVGTIDSAYGGSPTVPPGSGGAGVVWDMSSVTTIFAAKLTVVSLASTPYAATFPTATFCVKVDGTSTTYNFDRLSSVGVENLCITYAGAGVGTDYSPNPRLSVPVPFHYLDGKSDTFQTTTSGPDTVRLTYDGYGTLKTPFYTYTNVVRIKEDYGTHYSYSWYTVSPFALIMNYSSSSNAYVIVKTAPVPSAVDNIPDAIAATICPNPASGDPILTTNIAGGYNNASVTITDASGRKVGYISVTSPTTIIPTKELVPGLYYYTLENNGMKLANGRLIIN